MNQQARNLSRPQTVEDSDAFPPVVPVMGSVCQQMIYGFRSVYFYDNLCLFSMVICYLWDILQLMSQLISFVRSLQIIDQLKCVVDGGKTVKTYPLWTDASQSRDSYGVTGPRLMFLSITQQCWLSQIFYVVLSSRFGQCELTLSSTGNMLWMSADCVLKDVCQA